MFKKEDNLTKELKMLPRETKKRILENVVRRKNEILEERLLEKELSNYNKSESKPSKWSSFRSGMQKRREELTAKGIIKPPIRYNKQNFRSALEEMSIKSRADEIKRLENQRTKLKSGISFNSEKIKLNDLKLKVPTSQLKKKIKNGFI